MQVDNGTPGCIRPKIYQARTSGGNKTEHNINTKKYSDDGLSGYTVSSLKTGHHRYILFMVCSAFFSPAVRDWYILGLKLSQRLSIVTCS